MKRAIAMQLCLVLGIGLLSGCGGDEIAMSSEAVKPDNMDGELMEAYDMGLLPDEWL